MTGGSCPWNTDPVQADQAERPYRRAEALPHLEIQPAAAERQRQPGSHLAEVSEAFAEVLLRKAGLDIDVDGPIEFGRRRGASFGSGSIVDRGSHGYWPNPEAAQLALSRRGQGVFKANVRLNGKTCRCTGVSHPSYSWPAISSRGRNAPTKEKLDGCNGIMLSPHVDRLFDRGFISFQDNGGLKISSKPAGTLEQWGLQSSLNVGPFSPKQ